MYIRVLFFPHLTPQTLNCYGVKETTLTFLPAGYVYHLSNLCRFKLENKRSFELFLNEILFFTLLFRKNCKNIPIFIQLKKKSNKCIFLPGEQHLQTCYALDCWGKEIYSTSDLTNIVCIQYWMNVKAVIETLDGSSLQWDNEFNKLYSSPQAQNQQIWYSIQCVHTIHR